jgi:hypothetical protein
MKKTLKNITINSYNWEIRSRPEEADDDHDCTNYCKNVIRLNYFSYGR